MKLLPILFMFAFSSCAMLGSTSTVQRKPIRQLQHVAVLIAMDEIFTNVDTNAEYLLFTKSLAEELSDRKMFRFTILDKRYSLQALDEMETSLLSLELRGRYDAILICSPKFQFNTTKVSMRLHQTDPAFEVMRLKHSTNLGNSYWMFQSSAGILVDATRGAVDILETRLKRLY